MTYEEAVRKATLLLRKAQGNNNVNEAALFAAKAQEIMDRFQITSLSAELEPGKTLSDEPVQSFNNEPALTACQKDKNWTLRLSGDVARANGCKVWFMPRAGGADVYLVGKASDVQTARYMIGLLAEEVRRLGRECCKGYSEKYRRDFRYGVAEAIAVKLREQWERTKAGVRADTQGNPLALMRVDNALVKMEQRLSAVDVYMKEKMNLNFKYKSHYDPGMSARAHGYQEGKKIQINRASGALGAGQKSITQ